MIDFRGVREQHASAFDFVRLALASPEDIRGPSDAAERERLAQAGQRNWWSWGEVTRATTVHYRSLKPERNGLFCERIFGPTKNWECRCGKHKGIRYKDVICEHCGVQVTRSRARRERMGHIELAVPIVHTWFFRTRKIIPVLLDLPADTVESIVYRDRYVVVSPSSQPLKKYELLDRDEYFLFAEFARESGDAAFKAATGGEGIRTLLRALDLDGLATRLRADANVVASEARRRSLLRRLRLVEAFRQSGSEGGARNQPEWMVLEAVPVLPPDLRPVVPAFGHRVAASDLNVLYRDVLNRNNRLRQLMKRGAPEVVLRNAQRLLQEAVDALFDNGRRTKAHVGRDKRVLQSFTHLLGGKHGRFRRSLLGKRVDYSGRSVIAPGPELELHQCGLPKSMAIELFKPFLIHELVRRSIVETVKRAMRLVHGTMTLSGGPEENERRRARNPSETALVYEILADVMRGHPVLLNRAPTLHRLSVQAFEPVLVEGNAIRIHPLVCAAFNADFDGDQMAVHVPLSMEARREARDLLMSTRNIIGPSNGQPICEPAHEIAVGCYFATKSPPGFADIDPETLPRLTSAFAVEHELALYRLELQSPIRYYVCDQTGGRWQKTTAGRVLFNAILPKDWSYRNAEMTMEALSALVLDCFRELGAEATAGILDRLKEFGFAHATVAGVSIGIEDLQGNPDVSCIFERTTTRVARLRDAESLGHIDEVEAHDLTLQQWLDAFEAADDDVRRRLATQDEGLSALGLIVGSGARGSIEVVRQLSVAKGLIASRGAGDEMVERPILSSYREGLRPADYLRGCFSARRAAADHSIRTARSGYLMRRIVDAAQSVTITIDDCGTHDHSVAACAAAEGLCRQCYGRGLNGLDLVEVGTPVGVIAAQSIGEPITQRLLDAKHGGGISSFMRRHSGAEPRIIADVGGVVRFVDIVEDETLRRSINTRTNRSTFVIRRSPGSARDPRIEIVEPGPWRDRAIATFILPDGARLTAIDGSRVHAGAVLAVMPVSRFTKRDAGRVLASIETLLEARVPEGAAVLTEIDGVVRVGGIHGGGREVFVTALAPPSPGHAEDVRVYSVLPGTQLLVRTGASVRAGDRLCEGSINPHDVLRIAGPLATHDHLLRELQWLYSNSGVVVDDRHFAVVIRQMLRRVRVDEPGTTDLVHGDVIDARAFAAIRDRAEAAGGMPPTARPVLLGISQANLASDSFLAAASFEETTRVVVDAAIRGARDDLHGIKENVIAGRLIPAGTGFLAGRRSNR